MKTSMLVLRVSLLTFVVASACKPPAGSRMLAEAEAPAGGGTPFLLMTTYKSAAKESPGTYEIKLGGPRSGGKATGGVPSGWRLDAAVPRFRGAANAEFVTTGQPIRLQFEMKLAKESSEGTGAGGGSKACGGDTFNPGGIELKATSDGSINCDPALTGTAGGASDKWCDSEATCYPYCTTAKDTGGGFGWQPELNGPNDGSCKIKSESTSTALGQTAGDSSKTWCDDAGKCYPYCTNGSDTGNGFGWQPDLGGPGEGSCRVKSNANATSSEKSVATSAASWCDESGQCYPYCTNAADDGRGFGWQPDLGGPNGGSCKIQNGGSATAPAGPTASASADNWCDGGGQCYPYCTNAADVGGGFGWQPELGGPNGGSCKIAGNSAAAPVAAQTTEEPPVAVQDPGGDSVWCDAAGVCYPYCTNGVDTGGGFGWQPELGGPSGGSCKLP